MTNVQSQQYLVPADIPIAAIEILRETRTEYFLQSISNIPLADCDSPAARTGVEGTRPDSHLVPNGLRVLYRLAYRSKLSLFYVGKTTQNHNRFGAERLGRVSTRTLKFEVCTPLGRAPCRSAVT